jgi:hypothetical protein
MDQCGANHGNGAKAEKMQRRRFNGALSLISSNLVEENNLACHVASSAIGGRFISGDERKASAK